MRLSLVIATMWALATGTHVLANSMLFEEYDLATRNFELEDLDARSFYEPCLDIDERDQFYQDLDSREDLDNGLWERDMFEYYLAAHIAARDEEESMLQLRYDDEELKAGGFFDYEPDSVTREDGLEAEILPREPLRYRIGIVVHPHEN